MKVLITGAHFTPAVAVINELKKFREVNIVYVGRKSTLEGDNAPSVESSVLASLGVKFIPITTGRLQRSFTLYTIPSLLKIPIGLLQSIFILFRERPDVILSFGGYVGVPLVIIGWLFSIPVIIHEQGLLPGLANRVSSLFADKIAVSFAKSGFNGEKVILTGNPIRSEVVAIVKDLKSSQAKNEGRLPVLLIMGGSQGSHAINLALEECLGKLIKIVRVIHQTGDSKFKDYERLNALTGTSDLSGNYDVRKWIGNDYGKVLQEADLVLCRAGINTLTELALVGKPALLVPIENKEQNKNAGFFEKIGLARVIPQAKLNGDSLLKEISFMLKNLNSLKQKAKQAKKSIVTDSSKRLSLETVLLAKKAGIG